MKNPRRLVAAIALVFIGCGDFTPVQTQLVNGGDGAVAATLNGCTPDLFVDRSAPGDDRTIGFGGENGSGGFTYAPKCMIVARGQDVRWVGAFASHPLTRGVPGDTAGGSPGSPIAGTMAGTSVTVNFPRAGTFPFVCGMHAFLGMTGVVLVR